MKLRHLSLDPLDLRRDELDDLAAARADEMLVVRPGGARLVPFEPFSEIVLSDETGFAQQLERAIHRGLPHRPPPFPQPRQDLLGGNVVVGAEEDLGDAQTLGSHRMVMRSEIGFESLEYRLARVGRAQRAASGGRMRSMSSATCPTAGAPGTMSSSTSR